MIDRRTFILGMGAGTVIGAIAHPTEPNAAQVASELLSDCEWRPTDKEVLEQSIWTLAEECYEAGDDALWLLLTTKDRDTLMPDRIKNPETIYMYKTPYSTLAVVGDDWADDRDELWLQRRTGQIHGHDSIVIAGIGTRW